MDKKKRKSFISIRGGFSDSNGISPCNTQMQLDDFDDKTRILISNRLFEFFEIFFENYDFIEKYKGHGNASNEFCKSVLCNAFGKRTNLDEGHKYIWRVIFEDINLLIVEAPYNEVLDIIQYSCNWLNNNYCFNKTSQGIVYEAMNNLFEQEYVGYRFVDGRIVSITDTTENDEIEKACSTEIEGCKSHIKKAVGFLSDRDNKDYKNCIKESISAVETICQIITEGNSTTLGSAIKKLKDNGLEIHPALENAFLKLYRNTSDEGGIRQC